MTDHIRLARLSLAAYGRCTFRNKDSDTEVLVEGDVIAFRGSTSIWDWLRDARIIKAPFIRDGKVLGWVHSGFLGAFLSVTERLTPIINQLPAATFTGHSLGGGIATLAAAWYGQRKPVRLVTFGSPRVGDEEFSDLFAEIPAARYVYGSDPVTYVPKVGYEHVGEAVYLGPQWWFGLRRVWPWRADDHRIQNYIAALEARK